MTTKPATTKPVTTKPATTKPATTTRTTRAASPPAPGFREALAFEWTKFAGLRSTRLTLLTTGLLTVIGAVFVGLSGSLQPDDTVLGGSLTLSVVSLMVAGAVGALTVCGEYASGTIAATLTAVPRRGRVLAAKAVLLVCLLYGTGLVSCTAAYLVGGAVLEDGKYAQGDPLPGLFGIAGLFALVGLLGLAVGILLKHSAGAVVTVVGVLLLPSLFGPLLGDLQRWVAGATPTAALEKLTQTSDASPETVGSLGAWPSLGLVAAYTLLLIAVAGWRLRRRDV